MSFELHITKKGNKKITYICDRCEKTKVKKYKQAKKMKPLPKGWAAAHLTYLGDDEPTRYDLCPECVEKFKALGNLIDNFARFYMRES